MKTNAQELQDTIDAIDEARVIVNHTLSTIGFKGNAMRLVIEEVQFALRPAAVFLRHGKTTHSNVIVEHEKLLRERIEHATSAKDRAVAGSETTCRAIKFPSVMDATPATLLLCLDGIDQADEFTYGDSVLTVFYGGKGEEGERPSATGHKKLLEAVARFLKSCDGYLAKADAQPSQSAGNGPGEKKPDLQDILPKLASESFYLRLVLSELRDQILQQLKEVDEPHFGQLSKNQFSLQFFLLVDNPEGEGSLFPGKHLRYFPLKNEREHKRFQEIRTASPRSEKPSDADFITQYPWSAGQSLIGYTFAAEASRFFGDWESEPRAQGEGLSREEKAQRQTATRIMQHLRGDHDHQFNIPLFACGQIFGAIIVNTPDRIHWEAQRIPVRCARQVGSMIESALKMDPDVNDYTRKVAAAEAKADSARVYRHMLSSMLHEEVYYLGLLRAIYDSVYKQVGSPFDWQERFKYALNDRAQLLEEFNKPKEPQSDAPIRSVETGVLYNDGPSIAVQDVKFDDLVRYTQSLRSIFSIRDKLAISWPNRDRTPTIPQLKLVVLLRILGNLLRNTNACAEKVRNPSIEFSFAVVTQNGKEFLQIVAKDNCGGFRFDEDRDFPRGKITFASWDGYLKRRDEKSKRSGGMGFLTMLKYTTSTEGELYLDNHTNDVRETGACVTLLIGLESRRKSP